MDEQTKELFNSIPDSVKDVISSQGATKLATAATGIEDFTLQNVAQYFGEKTASRKAKWRPVAEGMLALHKLRGA